MIGLVSIRMKRMSWNYRIVARKYGDDEYYYDIHEVYYDNDGSIKMWTRDGVGIGGYSVEELRSAYKMYGVAFNKPLLYWHEDEEELNEKAP